MYMYAMISLMSMISLCMLTVIRLTVLYKLGEMFV